MSPVMVLPCLRHVTPFVGLPCARGESSHEGLKSVPLLSDFELRVICDKSSTRDN
jgi:hypothetical protein